MTTPSWPVGGPDLMSGAADIADEIFDNHRPESIRRVRHYYETNQLPIFSFTPGTILLAFSE